MPAYKDEKTGKWYCQFYCKDWTGKNKHIVKRGFDKKKDYILIPKSITIDMEYRDLEKSVLHLLSLYKRNKK